MRDQILKSVRTLAAVLPMLALAQPLAAQREQHARRQGSWEFSVGGGVLDIDDALATYLGSTGFTSNAATPSRFAPVVVGRLGYNINKHLGFSYGAGYGWGGGVNYMTPFTDVTYTVNLNAGTSPFLTGGAQFTRITGNSRVTHPTWGARAGLGVRHMLSENLALRLEGRMAFEHYEELPGRKATYTPTVTLGISYFTAGRHAPPVAMAPPCPVCVARVRVDTIVRVRTDTLRRLRVDTVHIMEQSEQLVLRVNFETNRTEILPQSRPVLDTIAFAIIATPRARWEVQGHTDSIGTAEANRILAKGRAQAVVDYLVSKGVDRSVLTATGVGPDRPVFSNSTVYGRAQNRRVQIRRVPPPPTGPAVP
jgi:outer membrane protein OmpA-like peptidoglycan-associated protein